MTTDEFKTLKSALAYQAVMFDLDIIDKKGLITALRFILGADIFQAAADEIKKSE